MNPRSKKKVALIFAYNGANFSGNQIQSDDSVRTVEPELEKALYDASLIADSNYRNLSKIKWTRASRTDKGVHALSTVVGVKLLFDDRPLPEIIAGINQHLPSDIRIIAIKPVVQSFNAKNSCSFREYQYLFPCKALGVETDAEFIERVNRITEVF